MPNGSARVDQSFFEEAIEEVRRLEGLLVERREITPEALAGNTLFEAIDTSAPSVTTWEKAFDDALRIEQKLGISAGKPRTVQALPSRPVQRVTEEDRKTRETSEIDQMKSRFAEEEKKKTLPAVQLPTPAEQGPAARLAEEIAKPPVPPVPVEAPKPAAREEAPSPKVAIEVPKPAAKAEIPPEAVPLPSQESPDDEKISLMRERLSRVLEQKKIETKPKKTLFEILESKGKIGAKPAELPQPKPAQGQVLQPKPAYAEESQKSAPSQSQRIDALKKELAEKVRKRKEEEERRKKIESLGKDIEGMED